MAKSKLGDCFIWTGRFALENGNKKHAEIISPLNQRFFGRPYVVHAVFKSKDHDYTIGHAFIEDDRMVYDKNANKKGYKIHFKQDYYNAGISFHFENEILRTKIVSYKRYTFKKIVILMSEAGGVFKSFGIKHDF